MASSDNIVLEGKVDALSNSKFDNKRTEYDTVTIEQNNGQVSHLKNVVVLGALTSYLTEGFKGKLFLRKIKEGEYLVLALETTEGKKILDDEAINAKFKESKSVRKSSYIAITLGVLLTPIIIGIFFIASGVTYMLADSKNYDLFDFEKIKPFLEENGFQTT